MRYLLIGMLVIAAAGCDEKLSDVTGPTPGLEVSYSSIQSEIFSSSDSSGRVACTNCHNAGNAQNAAGLNLEANVSYAMLVGVAARQKAGAVRVIPGDPDNSYLVQKLEGASGIVGQRMPRTSGPFLTEGQMSVIRRWILEGANND